MTVSRVQAIWGGYQGAPGYTNLYFTNLIGSEQLGIDAAQEFFENVFGTSAEHLPTAVTINVSDEVLHFDEVTGLLTDIGHGVAPSAIPGTGSGGFATPAGICISWRTGQIANGRLIRGRTFLVPLSANSLETNGTPGSTTLASATAAAQNLIATGPTFSVWHRPVNQLGGAIGVVVGSNITDQVAVLRSRR